MMRWFCTILALGAGSLLPCALAQSAKPISEESKQEAKSSQHVEVVCRIDDRERTLKGRVIVEAADGGLLLQTADGQLWIVEAGNIVRRTALDKRFAPISHEDLSEKLLAELPAGFRTHTTPHYVVAYNTSRAYAQWTSSLLERLHKAFTNYWENEGIELR